MFNYYFVGNLIQKSSFFYLRNGKLGENCVFLKETNCIWSDYHEFNILPLKI